MIQFVVFLRFWIQIAIQHFAVFYLSVCDYVFHCGRDPNADRTDVCNLELHQFLREHYENTPIQIY